MLCPELNFDLLFNIKSLIFISPPYKLWESKQKLGNN